MMYTSLPLLRYGYVDVASDSTSHKPVILQVSCSAKNVCVCVCVCMYVCMCVCVYMCTCLHVTVCVHTHMYVCIRVCAMHLYTI